jgi:predicted alpha/beta superfamily hydrolase
MGKQKFTIDPPPKEGGPEKLYRVVYIIDVNAADPKEAAGFTHQIMTDPESLPPVLHVIDEGGKSVEIDLSKED